MNLKESIRKILREQHSKKEMLRDYAKENGLDFVLNMVGGVENYIRISYDGDIKEYYKNEDVRPYYIKEGDGINMYLDNALVEYLNLEDFRDGEKKLGEFTFGKKNGTKFRFDARLMKVTRMGKTIGWKVVGMSGSNGLGYSCINVSVT